MSDHDTGVTGGSTADPDESNSCAKLSKVSVMPLFLGLTVEKVV